VILRNRVIHKKWPSANFLVAWVALHFWWLPILRQPEYNMLVVPFFHSLQYLPFAYRLEKSTMKPGNWYHVRATVRVMLILLAGFVAFEGLPSFLDVTIAPNAISLPWFFVGCFSVFINIHHFFIDSVVWKFNQKEVARGILERGSFGDSHRERRISNAS